MIRTGADYLESVHGDYRWTSTLLVALSANGKTSTSCKILAKKGNEQSWLVQDDGGTLTPGGAFMGFEAGGVFVKTEGVNPGQQQEIYYGLLKPSTVCENVYVTPDGDYDFYNFQKTSNGRAVVCRRDFMHASRNIDVENVDNLILITRGPLIPAISKLTREQAAALRHIADALARNQVRRALRKVVTVKFDDTVAARHQTHDAAERGCLPDTVAAEQGGTLTFLHLQADALQDVQLADVNVNVA